MKYEDIRGTLKSGDLAFYSSHHKIGDWLIKWWTKSEYSHVGLIWVAAGRVFLLEASAADGVRIVPLSLRMPDTIVRMDLNWDAQTEEFAFSHMMDPYSFVDAIRAGVNQHYKGAGWICTEYVAAVVAKCGYLFSEDSMVPQKQIVELVRDKKVFVNIELP